MFLQNNFITAKLEQFIWFDESLYHHTKRKRKKLTEVKLGKTEKTVNPKESVRKVPSPSWKEDPPTVLLCPTS